MSDHQVIPDTKTLEAIASIDVFDVKGEKVKFGSLYADQRTIVVFIRHFICGACQAYVELLAGVPKAALDAAGTKLVVVGCGDWQPIKDYAELTGFQGDIYANPGRELYESLNLMDKLVMPPDHKAISYIKKGLVALSLQSIWRGPIQHPSWIGKQGNTSQLGGDFVFGPGNTCSFASRMRHSADHVDIGDLMKQGGVEYTVKA